jgi:predicted O-methyltransferase YrrM
VKQQPDCGPPTPVPILQWEAEFTVLLELYLRLKPNRVLEVGTYHGGTLYHWLQNAQPGARIVSLDSYVTDVDNRHLYEDWKPEGVTLHAIEADSHEDATRDAVERLGPFDWLFIDAGHFLPEVTRDWELYSPLVLPGGVAVLHDILTHPAWPSIEVGQLWEQIRKEHLTFEIVANRDAEWGGLGVVLVP